MIAKYFGKSYSLQSLRSKSFITKSGVSMLGISDAAESIGFRTRGYRLTWEQLRDEVPLPCIVHWNQRHFVVVYAIKTRHSYALPPWGKGRGRSKSNERRIRDEVDKRGRIKEGADKSGKNGYNVLIADPASGLLSYTEYEFFKCW
jgi:ABC-type bacteriocin/lantibiotic exporter with double-glycine peptidase domain